MLGWMNRKERAVPTPMTILASEAHTMQSAHTGRTYSITVSLPLAYHKPPGEPWPFNDTPDPWPTVYVFDGNWYAAMVTGIIRPMAWCGGTTDAIVVGIGYPEGSDVIDAYRESFTRRDHDMTPVYDATVEREMTAAHGRPTPNGDAANFHAFIRDELIPFIEATYRADPAKRILVGHSYGGLFGLFGLFTTPALFQQLVIGSPTLTYGGGFVMAQEAAFAQANTRLSVAIYLFMGDIYEDDADETNQFAAAMLSRGYDGFSLVQRLFNGENHCEVAAPGIHWGLKHALKRT